MVSPCSCLVLYVWAPLSGPLYEWSLPQIMAFGSDLISWRESRPSAYDYNRGLDESPGELQKRAKELVRRIVESQKVDRVR